MGALLVSAQVGCCLYLIWFGGRGVIGDPRLWFGVAAGVAVSASGVWAMRVSRVKLTPEPGAEAELCDRGIYAHLRHPMYAGLLLAFAMFAIGAGGWGGWIVWGGLLAVLLVKLGIEERLWSERDPAYRDYMKRTRRLIPGVF